MSLLLAIVAAQGPGFAAKNHEVARAGLSVTLGRESQCRWRPQRVARLSQSIEIRGKATTHEDICKLSRALAGMKSWQQGGDAERLARAIRRHGSQQAARSGKTLREYPGFSRFMGSCPQKQSSSQGVLSLEGGMMGRELMLPIGSVAGPVRIRTPTERK